MASQFIGVIVGTVTGTVYAVINPDEDADLDNPRFLLIKGEELEPLRMRKIPRGDYEAALSMDDVAAIIAKMEA